MRTRILADHYEAGEWLTMADVARMVERTRQGARWIVEQEQLTSARTACGYRLFRESDVLRLVDDRAKARRRGVTRLRPRKFNVHGQPRQLPLW